MITEILRALVLSALVSSAAILLVLVLRKPIRVRLGAHSAYALWLLVPLSAVTTVLPAPVKIAPVAVMLAAALPAPTATSAVSVPVRVDPTPWLLAAWLCGAGICLAVLLWQQRRFVRALGRLDELRERGALRAQATAGCPALIGAWRPRIVLPADFEQRYSAVERDLILAHERCHMARYDAQLNALAAALRCLNWFNPLFHFAAARFRFDQELACDAAVIAHFPEARRPYADAMLKTQLADIGLPAGCYWQSSHPLKERIAMLKQPLPGRTRRVLGAAVSIALVFSGGYAAWAMQPAQSERSAAGAPSALHASYRKLHRIAYPAAALAAKAEGIVYVQVHVGADGAVASADVAPIGPLPNKLLAEAAVGGVRTWTFNPASKDGKPITSEEIVPIVFFLNPDSIPKTSGGTLDAIRIGAPEPTAQADTEVEYINSALKAPKYPAAARVAHQTGKLVVKVHVDANGMPESASVDSGEPPEAQEIFGAGAIAAAMDWRFKPATHAGRPVDGYILVPISYDMREEKDD